MYTRSRFHVSVRLPSTGSDFHQGLVYRYWWEGTLVPLSVPYTMVGSFSEGLVGTTLVRVHQDRSLGFRRVEVQCVCGRCKSRVDRGLEYTLSRTGLCKGRRFDYHPCT